VFAKIYSFHLNLANKWIFGLHKVWKIWKNNFGSRKKNHLCPIMGKLSSVTNAKILSNQKMA